MQFTKLRSGLTWPPFRALLRPTAPTPMPAPTPDRRRHVPKSESFLHQLRDRAGIVSCRPSAGEVPLWGPQTGTSTLTEFRQCAGDRHSTGSVTAAPAPGSKNESFLHQDQKRIFSASFARSCGDRVVPVECRRSATLGASNRHFDFDQSPVMACAGHRHSTGSVTAAAGARLKNESFLHQSRDRAGIVSCRSSAGEVPLWGPQTGTSILTEVR